MSDRGQHLHQQGDHPFVVLILGRDFDDRWWDVSGDGRDAIRGTVPLFEGEFRGIRGT